MLPLTFIYVGVFLYKKDDISTSLSREHYFIENKKMLYDHKNIM